MKKHILISLIAGILLYLLTILSACLTFLNINDGLFSVLLTAAFVLGAWIVVILVIRHRRSWKWQLISGLLWQAAFVVLFLLDSFVGITRSLVSFPEDNLAGGLVIVLFWLSCTGLSVIGFLFTATMQLIKRLKKSK